jgi:predicted aldo/keto reductase-like oxidoreductase
MKENHVSRRDFVKALGVAGVGSMIGAGRSLAQSNAPVPAAPPVAVTKVPQRPFGRTGAQVSILGLGGMFSTTSNQVVMKQAYDWGVTYWDTAAGYGSEAGMGLFLEKYPEARKHVFLVTKYDGGGLTMTEGLNKSLEGLRTDYIDMYFLHTINNPNQFTDEIKAWAEKAKAEKKIRFFGYSSHANMEVCLQAAAKLGWIDGVMMTYNHRLMHTDAMKAAVDAATKAGIGLNAMKSQSGGQLGTDTEADLKLGGHFLQRGYSVFQARLKAVWENPQIASIVSQMPNLTNLHANIAAALDKTALTAADHAAMQAHADATRSGYCAGCTRLCGAALNQRVPVGDVMRALMYQRFYGDPELARRVFRQLPEATRRDLAGLNYAAAEQVCPQGLPIGPLMREAAELFA